MSALRQLTADNDIVLIFDEVISGFRVNYGGAQTLYGIKPDLTVLGKIIGGGLPVGAYGGRKEIMDLIAPLGPVYQAGTLSGNPLAVTAGLATLKQLRTGGVYKQLEDRSAVLAKGLGDAAKKAGVPVTQTRVGSMLTTFFTPGPVVDWNTAKQSDTKRYGKFFHRMLEQGVYLAPSQFEAAFLSTAHSVQDIEKIRVDIDPARRLEMMQRTGRRTVPQIYIDSTHVGGCDDLYALNDAGRLDALLSTQASGASGA